MTLLKRIEERLANPELNANFNREVIKRKEIRNHGEIIRRTNRSNRILGDT